MRGGGVWASKGRAGGGYGARGVPRRAQRSGTARVRARDAGGLKDPWGLRWSKTRGMTREARVSRGAAGARGTGTETGTGTRTAMSGCQCTSDSESHSESSPSSFSGSGDVERCRCR